MLNRAEYCFRSVYCPACTSVCLACCRCAAAQALHCKRIIVKSETKPPPVPVQVSTQRAAAAALVMAAAAAAAACCSSQEQLLYCQVVLRQQVGYDVEAHLIMVPDPSDTVACWYCCCFFCVWGGLTAGNSSRSSSQEKREAGSKAGSSC